MSSTTQRIRWLGAFTGLLASLAAPAAAQTPVPIDIRFTLIGADDRPIANEPVRLVVAAGTDWQSAVAGTPASTNEAGEIRWSTSAPLESRRRKRTTNFFSQAMSSPQATTHLALGAQLRWFGHTWLVVGEADHFADGTTALMDGWRVYGLDAKGAFATAATMKDGVWQLPGLPWPLTAPGFQIVRFKMTPTGAGWAVDFGIRRMAEPVQR